tara:strand:- start:9577 stop:9981 length:405 start_codon:yes stop_codon:yes gene_type:complete
MIYDNLPDDIIDYIYSKILFKKDKDFCLEIKIHYYIMNNLLKTKKLKDIYTSLIIHQKDNIYIDEINELSNLIDKYDDNLIKLYIFNILKKLTINSKIEFLFYIHDYTIYSNKICNKYYIKNKIICVIDNFIYK